MPAAEWSMKKLARGKIAMTDLVDCDSTTHRRDNTKDLVGLEVLDIQSAGKVPDPESRYNLVH